MSQSALPKIDNLAGAVKINASTTASVEMRFSIAKKIEMHRERGISRRTVSTPILLLNIRPRHAALLYAYAAVPAAIFRLPTLSVRINVRSRDEVAQMKSQFGKTKMIC